MRKSAPSKRMRSTTEMDPVVETARAILENGVQHFLGNIGPIIEKFQNYHRAASSVIEAQPRLKELNEAGATLTTAAANAAASGSTASDESKPTVIGAKVVINPTDDENVVEVEFPDNTELKKQLKLLKREAYEMSTILEGIVDWIDLNAPEKLKGQEDVGAEIQDAVTEQVANLSEAVGQVYELEMKYLGERAELETTLLAMPEVKSIALSMEIHDSDVWDEVERAWKTMLRVVTVCYSVVSKNISKLREPVSALSTAANSIYQ